MVFAEKQSLLAQGCSLSTISACVRSSRLPRQIVGRARTILPFPPPTAALHLYRLASSRAPPSCLVHAAAVCRVGEMRGPWNVHRKSGCIVRGEEQGQRVERRECSGRCLLGTAEYDSEACTSTCHAVSRFCCYRAARGELWLPYSLGLRCAAENWVGFTASEEERHPAFARPCVFTGKHAN